MLGILIVSLLCIYKMFRLMEEAAQRIISLESFANIWKMRYKLCHHWLNKAEGAISNSLVSRRLNKIGIYGMGELGEHLVKTLQKEKRIEIAFFMDKQMVYDAYGVAFKQIGEKIPDIDAIIVTPFMYISDITNELKAYYDVQFISLEDIIYNA